ncbi:hypothetical protein PO909_033662 [Leuciscus waleckii]
MSPCFKSVIPLCWLRASGSEGYQKCVTSLAMIQYRVEKRATGNKELLNGILYPAYRVSVPAAR